MDDFKSQCINFMERMEDVLIEATRLYISLTSANPIIGYFRRTFARDTYAFYCALAEHEPTYKDFLDVVEEGDETLFAFALDFYKALKGKEEHEMLRAYISEMDDLVDITIRNTCASYLYYAPRIAGLGPKVLEAYRYSKFIRSL